MPPEVLTQPSAPAAPVAPSAPAPVAAPAPSPAPTSSPSSGGDFDLSAIPEQVRPAVEPVFRQHVEKYQKEISQIKEGTKAFQEKAMALDKLLQEPWFQKAWFDRQGNPVQEQRPQAPQGPVVTPEEWQAAYDKALAGDMTAMNQLTEKQLDSLVQQKYEPVMKQMATKQREIELSMEMTDLFNNHPDARDLDKAGLLEPALHLYTDKQGKPMEVAYQEAKKVYDYILNKSKQELTAQAQEKKASVTETPASANTETGVVYVDTPQQALRQQLIATGKGLKVTYRVRPKK